MLPAAFVLPTCHVLLHLCAFACAIPLPVLPAHPGGLQHPPNVTQTVSVCLLPLEGRA